MLISTKGISECNFFCFRDIIKSIGYLSNSFASFSVDKLITDHLPDICISLFLRRTCSVEFISVRELTLLFHVINFIESRSVHAEQKRRLLPTVVIVIVIVIIITFWAD